MIDRIKISINFGSTDIPVGELVEAERRYFFTYDSDFPAETMRLSPFKLPFDKNLAHEVSEKERRVFGGVHGVFADSLPDGWGLLLIKRSVESRGRFFLDLTPLDLLSFAGERTLGALRYRPVQILESGGDSNTLDLAKIGRESEKIFEGEESKILGSLFRLGGSPGGARPKVLAAIGRDKNTHRIIKSDLNTLPENFEHWIIKFRGKGDAADEAIAEFLYMQAAKSAGLIVPECDLFESKGQKFFGVKRFDIESSGKRYHMHSLAGLLHADFRTPALDYKDFLKATKLLTQSQSDVRMGFRIAVFNVFFHNRDDHAKNFSFLMDETGRWRLAPAYDLTYSNGPGGEHTTSVLGEGKNITEDLLIKLGETAGIGRKDCLLIIDEVKLARVYAVKNLVEWGLKKHPLVMRLE
ncbi:MAG: type II toxin-antitoxin system HipA family toxin [Chitinophagaceae bacterium]|nr:type II toxin-antitoxin system HipA family toxin [Oligoflexus sp.]